MGAVPARPQIGDAWQQRISALQEYEIVRDGNVFKTNIFRGCLLSSEHEQARSLLAALLQEYRQRTLEEVFHGTVETNDAGDCYLITSRHKITKACIDPEEYFGKIWRDLTLVHGIGSVTERRLKARGYTTIRDLAGHPRFRPAAGRVIRELENPAPDRIMDLLFLRHPRSHPMVLGAAGLYEPEDFLFLDIETLGLFSRPVILIGAGVIEGQTLVIHQFLLRSVDEEPAALSAALGLLATERPALVTYNGKAFDVPYLQERLAYYGMGAIGSLPHFDCLHFARGRWRGQFPSLRLSAIEREIFGIERADDVPGQMVPEFYEMYARTGNCGPLVPVVAHNRQDVLSLAMIFFHLLRESYGNC